MQLDDSASVKHATDFDYDEVYFLDEKRKPHRKALGPEA